ncbi:TfoX/Sxy family protein [Ferrovibrio sp.]|uniref:TfoX/Sxy family protein n=1 Tax=Ferrovibrio sp. TaxID=1917215 RepID=UPI0035B22BBF
MVASDSFAELLREQLAPLGHVALRRMFGKTGVFCDGVMLGMVRDNTLHFRVDDDNRAVFKEAEAFPPLNYEKARRDHRSGLLACAGTIVRRPRRASDLGPCGPRVHSHLH